jgi:hypothetical protein
MKITTEILDYSIFLSIGMGALQGLSLRLQKKYLIHLLSRPTAFFYIFISISMLRMSLTALFVYNLLHMEYLKGILNGIICVVTLFLLMQKKA